ncbi:histone-lysine N-methyltransferase eggless isoform X2 [Planococcus citri]|uniref:histone-lysine N-methyltransferase eggless isoform X2 n=1 Tax=Planococcus citri TaxID=170843 RepID=UPI0031F8C024
MGTLNANDGLSDPIELLSDDDEDDDDIAIIEDDEPAKKPSKRSRVLTECLNVQCKSGHKYIEGVPAFVLEFFKVNNKNGLKVCEECFDEACSYYADLEERLMKKQSLYQVPYQKYSRVLSIDSDEEDLSPEDDEPVLDDETVNMVEDQFGDIMADVVTKCNLAFQINDAHDELSNTASFIKQSSSEHDVKLEELQKEIDEIRCLIYDNFKPQFNELPELIIRDDGEEEDLLQEELPPVQEIVEVPFRQILPKDSDSPGRKSVARKHTTVSSPSSLQKDIARLDSKDSQDVVAVSEEIMEPPPTLPPDTERIVRPALKTGDIIYAMKHNYKYPWKKGVVVDIFTEKGYKEYQLKIDVTNPRKPNPSILLQGKSLAYPFPAPYRFAVGARIIAVFTDDRNTDKQTLFYSGIIAEPPKVMNKFRYLVFFDDGCTQYVPHENIRAICEPSAKAWDDVPAEDRGFIQNYLCQYPERPMVKLQPAYVIKVEFQRKWYSARVLEVDASLVKMQFMNDTHTEWIYRGSTRLEPLYKEIEAAKRRMQTGNRIRRIGKKTQNYCPYVEYTRGADNEEIEEPIRAVARKSTSANKDLKKVEKPKKWIPVPIPGHVEKKKVDSRIEPRTFKPHQCGLSCIDWTNFSLDKIKGIGPLAIPSQFGFRRMKMFFGGTKKNIVYRAPCGRQLRNMQEMHLYLRITKSQMTVDYFDFDFWVDCQAEFVITKCLVDVPDITQRKEKCPISCVNYIDNKLPDYITYMTEREPRRNVVLNLDPEFLCGCDCTDDCLDKKKCSCWQLTYEGQKLIPNNVMDPNVGYTYRRLDERVLTGIYECNERCKCSKRSCLNRVVQHPLSQKLQLYKTEAKGWGIRCLNDIPRGAFICVYAGHLLTEQEANEEGKTYGDEYLAELDYIEVIERTKEGYESDVPEELLEESDEESKGDSQPSQTMSKANVYKFNSSDSSSSEDVNFDRSTSSGDIRSRLRERKKPAAPVPVPEPKPKESKKKENFSIRKYCGDNEDDVFIMDAKSSGNIGRYLNHSCMPNAYVQNVFVDTHDLRFPWVAFFALTHIRAGSELTWDYNYDIGSVEGKVKYCYCGTQHCRGRLL